MRKTRIGSSCWASTTATATAFSHPSKPYGTARTSRLSRPLYIYVNKKSLQRPEVRAFVEFYIDNASKLAEEVGYVPVPDDVDASESRSARQHAEGGDTDHLTRPTARELDAISNRN